MIQRSAHPVLAAILIAGLAISCGRSALETAAEGVSTSLVATNAARDTFVDWDRRHQAGIVDRAASAPEAAAELAQYRNRRQRVVFAFSAAYSAIAAAASALALARSDRLVEEDAMGLAVDAVRKVLALKNSIADLTGEKAP